MRPKAGLVSGGADFKEGTVRALIIAAGDVGGCLAHLAHELRVQGIAAARVITGERDPQAGFDEDICSPIDGGAEARLLLSRADALHLVDLHPERTSVFGASLDHGERGPRPGILQIDRAPQSQWRALADAAGVRDWRLVTTRPAVAAVTGAELMLPFIPLARGPWRPLAAGTRSRESVRRPGLVFASARVPLRHRPLLERLLDDVEAELGPGQMLDTLVARPQRQVLRRRRYAHLTLSAGKFGLPLSALESLAQGVAVLADTPDTWVDAYAGVVGSPPPVYPRRALDRAIAAISPREPADPRLRAWAEVALDPGRWHSLCAEAYGPRRRVA